MGHMILTWRLSFSRAVDLPLPVRTIGAIAASQRFVHRTGFVHLSHKFIQLDFMLKYGGHWMRKAEDRATCYAIGEAVVQQWAVVG